MQKPRTSFEQIPVAVVKKIAEQIHDDHADGHDPVLPSTPPGKLRLHRLPLLGNNRKRL